MSSSPELRVFAKMRNFKFRKITKHEEFEKKNFHQLDGRKICRW